MKDIRVDLTDLDLPINSAVVLKAIHIDEELDTIDMDIDFAENVVTEQEAREMAENFIMETLTDFVKEYKDKEE